MRPEDMSPAPPKGVFSELLLSPLLLLPKEARLSALPYAKCFSQLREIKENRADPSPGRVLLF